ncbi:hypothetical protein [Nocardia wallacei]|uniref:hypothetical protein n=1 Tax=Nocardia wallacei TaxID=480035 RepID=UPI002456664A|nr:hypothetical protein [Nocardia wallacei]
MRVCRTLAGVALAAAAVLGATSAVLAVGLKWEQVRVTDTVAEPDCRHGGSESDEPAAREPEAQHKLSSGYQQRDAEGSEPGLAQ